MPTELRAAVGVVCKPWHNFVRLVRACYASMAVHFCSPEPNRNGHIHVPWSTLVSWLFPPVYWTPVGHTHHVQQGEAGMARRVLDKSLDSRDARRRLKIRGKPYYRVIERG